jgi:hypothetical protein
VKKIADPMIFNQSTGKSVSYAHSALVAMEKHAKSRSLLHLTYKEQSSRQQQFSNCNYPRNLTMINTVSGTWTDFMCINMSVAIERAQARGFRKGFLIWNELMHN